VYVHRICIRYTVPDCQWVCVTHLKALNSAVEAAATGSAAERDSVQHGLCLLQQGRLPDHTTVCRAHCRRYGDHTLCRTCNMSAVEQPDVAVNISTKSLSAKAQQKVKMSSQRTSPWRQRATRGCYTSVHHTPALIPAGLGKFARRTAGTPAKPHKPPPANMPHTRLCMHASMHHTRAQHPSAGCCRLCCVSATAKQRCRCSQQCCSRLLLAGPQQVQQAA
jgi:hypothetical protein